MRTWLLGALFALFGVLQLVPGVGVPDAMATYVYSSASNTCAYNKSPLCTREEAYAACKAAQAVVDDYQPKHSGTPPYPYANPSSCTTVTSFGGVAAYLMQQKGTSNEGWGNVYFGYGGCPAGTTWDELSHTCFDPDRCLAKPALGFTKVHAASAYDNVCSEGCQYSQSSALDIQFPNADGSVDGFTTGWKPTGEACAAGDPAPSPATPPQDCKPAGAGQTFCIKPNGDHCYSASTGRQICWRPGETGEKTDGSYLQQRSAGDAASAPPPSTPPPPGESFTPQGSPMGGSETVNGTGITTVVINYGTANGTNAGGSSPDQGENGDGTGGTSGGNTGTGGSGSDDGLNCDGCDNDDGSAAHAGDSIWGQDETETFTADESGLGFGTSCPAPPEIFGQPMDFADFCTLMQAIGLIVLAAAHLHALYIIMGD